MPSANWSNFNGALGIASSYLGSVRSRVNTYCGSFFSASRDQAPLPTRPSFELTPDEITQFNEVKDLKFNDPKFNLVVMSMSLDRVKSDNFKLLRQKERQLLQQRTDKLLKEKTKPSSDQSINDLIIEIESLIMRENNINESIIADLNSCSSINTGDSRFFYSKNNPSKLDMVRKYENYRECYITIGYNNLLATYAALGKMSDDYHYYRNKTSKKEQDLNSRITQKISELIGKVENLIKDISKVNNGNDMKIETFLDSINHNLKQTYNEYMIKFIANKKGSDSPSVSSTTESDSSVSVSSSSSVQPVVSPTGGVSGRIEVSSVELEALFHEAQQLAKSTGTKEGFNQFSKVLTQLSLKFDFNDEGSIKYKEMYIGMLATSIEQSSKYYKKAIDVISAGPTLGKRVAEYLRDENSKYKNEFASACLQITKRYTDPTILGNYTNYQAETSFTAKDNQSKCDSEMGGLLFWFLTVNDYPFNKDFNMVSRRLLTPALFKMYTNSDIKRDFLDQIESS